MLNLVLEQTVRFERVNILESLTRLEHHYHRHQLCLALNRLVLQGMLDDR